MKTRRSKKMGRIDCTGQIFGRLTVTGLGYVGSRYNGNPYRGLVCECECGNRVTIREDRILSGKTKSCGCLRDETRGKSSITHNKTNTSTYHIWSTIKDRCNNKNSKGWIRYGGRGISMCDRWSNSFENFLLDMGERPEGLQIDRIDNNGNYELNNCRWVTISQNSRNRRSNVNLTYKGETHTLVEWSEIMGVTENTLANRRKKGWDIERLLTKPQRKVATGTDRKSGTIK